MAVTDDLGTQRPPSQPDFDRQPPQDLQAEQSVLGGMLLSKDAIADVVEVLRATDFYRPAHQTVYDTILDLYGRGEPADPVTVSAELTRAGQLLRIGGSPYLHTLISSVPTAANAGFYAEIVAERATLRRLVEAGTRIVQLGYGAASGQGGDVDEVVDRAQAEIYDVTERRTSEDYVRLEQLLQGTMDEIDAISSRGGASIGVPTGFSELDQITNGLHPGQMVIIAARPAIGKALAVDTALPTPEGWTTMGEVRVGDRLLGADGRPTTVVAATEVLTDRPCYEVEFSDGTVIVADAQHQWRTTTRAARRARSEHVPPRYHWSSASIDRARRVAAVAAREPDRPVTRKDLVQEVGSEFRAVVHTAAQTLAPAAAHAAPRRVAGPRPLVYSRRTLATALAARVSRPRGVAQAAVHDDVVTTEQMARTLRCASADRRPNHAVALAAPLQLPDADLPVPPYTLGAWLGDGSTDAARLTTADPEIVARIEADGFRVSPTAGKFSYSVRLPERPGIVPARTCVVCGTAFRPATTQVRTCGKVCGCRSRALGLPPATPPTCTECGGPATTGFGPCATCRAATGSLQAILRRIGVLGDKHIPTAYLRASEAQRRALLAGLLDTDGTVSPTGTVVFAVTNHRLAEDVRELVLGLGYRATISTRRVKGRTAGSSTSYSVCFTPADPVFQLPRKLARQRTAVRTADQRYVVDVRPVPSVPVRCVQVDNHDHLYLASRSMVPTHNSTLALDFSRACSIRSGMTSVIFSLEMSKSEITMRLLSAEAKVPLHHMRSGHMSDDDWARLARRMGEVADAPLYIDDSPNLTMMEIRAKARRLKQRHDLRLVVIDYMQLMTSGKRVESRQVEVSEFSRSLKLLAKELEVPVVAISQLNRGPEQRTDKKPLLSDLRESGCMTEDTALLRADTGAPVTFRELLQDGHDGVLVWSLDEKRRLVPAPITNVFPSGVKPVYRLRLASGRGVQATGNHPFLTFRGWTPLDSLTVGNRIAIPRRTPAPVCAGLGRPDRRLGLLAAIGDRVLNTNVDSLPREAWDLVKSERYRAGVTERQFHAAIGTSYRGTALYKTGVSRQRMLRCADVLNSDALRDVATDDVFWDRIVAIEPVGVQPVYDATVKGTHNFIADGVIAHNSLEQDADMVILLHREDAYERESPRAGEADLILAKHRNGPTGLVTVAFQGHYSRFVDMAT